MTRLAAILAPLTDRQHPIWPLGQRLVSLFGLAVVVWHLAHGGKITEHGDAADMMGGVLVLKLAADVLGLRRGNLLAAQPTSQQESTMHMPAWLTVAAHFAPTILAFTPLAPIAGPVANAIREAEGIAGASGDEKRAHVKGVAVAAAEALNAEKGSIVLDPALVAQTADHAISTTIDAINLVHKRGDAVQVQPAG